MTFFSYSRRNSTAGLRRHETLEGARAYAATELRVVTDKANPLNGDKGARAWRAEGIGYGQILGWAVEDEEAEDGYRLEELGRHEAAETGPDEPDNQ